MDVPVKRFDRLAALAFGLAVAIMVLPTEADILVGLFLQRRIALAGLVAALCLAMVLVPVVLSWRRHWSHPEAWGTWSTGRKSELIFGIPDITEDLKLTVVATAFVHQRTPAKEFRVMVNDRPLASWFFVLTELPAKRSIVIPKDLLTGASLLRIAFVPNVVETPAKIGIVDARPIGLGLVELTISAEEQKN